MKEWWWCRIYKTNYSANLSDGSAIGIKYNINHKLDSKLNITNFDENNVEQLKEATKDWRDVFKITEEEDNNFDNQHSDQVNQYINANLNRGNTFPTVDLSRLNTQDYHTTQITLQQLKTYIPRYKHKAPGSTKINIQIL